jgi:DNA (cytosine-5)-methyltransferase 1
MTAIGELCSGYGGLGMAVQAAVGGSVVWHSEIDPAASKVLACRYPSVPNHGDLTVMDWSTVERVDVLTTGWPCQPWSQAGQRKGAEDERAIWPSVARAVRDLRPRFVVLENVPAIAAAGELARVVGDLAAVGYVGAWRCVRASDGGAPHRRERIFILAADGDGVGSVRTGGARRRGSGSPHHDQLAADGDGDGLQGVERLGAGPAGGRRRPPDENRTADIRVDWGVYSTAVERWAAILGRPAPEPTVTGARGGRQLSAVFVEWLMGLPPGWVTEVPGLSRNDQLKILGNGVVPQQAEAALRYLLADVTREVAA